MNCELPDVQVGFRKGRRPRGQIANINWIIEKAREFQKKQVCILSPCLFNLYAEYIVQNAGLDKAQAGIKITRRNISNLRYAYDTTLMAESEEELRSLLMKVQEESEKAKTQHS